MGKKIELAGQKFGRLLVLHDTGERKNGRVVWHCRCDCGKEVDVTARNLRTGDTKSCGCLKLDLLTTHGYTYHRLYRIWHDMLNRCENSNDPSYKNYGGRGIKVCEEWHNPKAFIDWALMNGWIRGLQINRIDNNGNYESSNCNFVTNKENACNRRDSYFITYNGKTQNLSVWAEGIGISPNVLRYRLLNWPIERALTELANGRHYNGH